MAQIENACLRTKLARVTEQRDILKNPSPLLSVNDLHACIQQLAPEHRIKVLCALLGVSRSGYYE